jgi:RimJ/RimL family protein N-acetyltransferase
MGCIMHPSRPQPDTITLRELVPEDRALLAAAFERLSPRSRYLRFLSPLPVLPERTLDRLLAVDGCEHVALAALHRGELVGVARYVRDRRDRGLADVALTVVDAHQGRGLGRRLLVALVELAADRGLRALTFDMHPSNQVAQRLMASLGARMAWRDGLLHGELPTPARGDVGLAA